MKYLMLVLSVFLSASSMAQSPGYLLVGTYTGGKSTGIYVYRFLSNGTAVLTDSVRAVNPSFLAVSPDQKFVYAVSETGAAEGGGNVNAYQFNKKKGTLTPINQQAAGGNHPCYLTVDGSGKWVIVGNYSSGNVTVLPIRKDGSLGPVQSSVQHKGSGEHSRQEAPHVHATVLAKNNRRLYVPDLGINKLMVYNFNPKNGTLTPGDTTLAMAPGAGPRHLDIHPNGKWLYLLQELSGTVTMFSEKAGTLRQKQTISVVPTQFKETFTSADIHVSPDGQHLYTSTRDAANLLTVFRIHQATGKLSLLGHQSTLGKTPRNFALSPSGNFLLAANQRSDEVVVFRVNKKTGLLEDSGHRVAVGSPVCLKWITD